MKRISKILISIIREDVVAVAEDGGMADE